jgi:ribosomal-protein-alanine N-acetyltransferase
MPKIPEIKGSCFVLRELNPEKDKEALWRNINHPEIINKMTLTYPYDEKQWEWFVDWNDKMKKGETLDMNWVIDIDGEVVGGVGLARVDKDWNRHVGSLGYWLVPKYWGKGIVSEAVGLVCDYAFNELELLKLKIDFFDDNKASRRVAEKNRFEVEGKMVKEGFKDGEYKDVVYIARFRDE